MTIGVNGVTACTPSLAGGWERVTCLLPASGVRQGTNLVSLGWPHGGVPADKVPGGDPRYLGLAVHRVVVRFAP